ncbi:hypothetical protein J6590_053738 [Homalodisca vitripennis]|nr:hypothetical protein J6590_053738 [Homalodisca vitripennis]
MTGYCSVRTDTFVRGDVNLVLSIAHPDAHGWLVLRLSVALPEDKMFADTGLRRRIFKVVSLAYGLTGFIETSAVGIAINVPK